MGSVVDPSGVRWRVRRRWYPWQRHFSLRDFFTNDATDESKPAEPTTEGAGTERSDAANGLPKNVVAKVLFVLLGIVVWIVVGLGKVLFYTGVIVLFGLLSLVELVVLLSVMPVVVVLRLLGLVRWPVEIGRQGKHFATRQAADFGAAGRLRDSVIGELEAGVTPADPRPATA